MNNNRADANALNAHCKGLFSAPSYITIGSAEEPFEYSSKPVERDSYKGKQFGVSPPKQGRTLDTYFEKAHPYIAEGLEFSDRIKYKDILTDKPSKGFGTSDYPRRDEFSNTIRTEQYREILKAERRILKPGVTIDPPDEVTPSAGATSPTSRNDVFLYDLVYDLPDPNATGASRLNRDTLNPTAHSSKRKLGAYTTTMTATYQPLQGVRAAEFAHKPVIRDTFFRRTNPFPSASPAS